MKYVKLAENPPPIPAMELIRGNIDNWHIQLIVFLSMAGETDVDDICSAMPYAMETLNGVLAKLHSLGLVVMREETV